jgi:DNA repair protein RadC
MKNVKYETSISELKLKRIETKIRNAQIKSSINASDYARHFYNDDLTIYESVFLILLNQQNITIGFAKISQGGVTGSVVDPKLLFKYCIDSLATSFILIHNHPSGNLKPSRSDIELTGNIKEGAKLINCKLIDHIILTKDNFFSFADEGIL